MRRIPSWSWKVRGENFSKDFWTQIFWGGVSRYAATPLIVALSPSHSDITRFRPWSPILKENHLYIAGRKNSKFCSDDWHRWRFWSASLHFVTHFAESFRLSRSSWIMSPTRSRVMPSYSAIDIAEILSSKNFGLMSDYIRRSTIARAECLWFWNGYLKNIKT